MAKIRAPTLGEAKYLIAGTCNLLSDGVRWTNSCPIEKLLDVDQFTFSSLSLGFILVLIENTSNYSVISLSCFEVTYVEYVAKSNSIYYKVCEEYMAFLFSKL